MLKKITAVLVVAAMLGILPILAGCGKTDVHTQTTQTQQETHMVVE